QQHNGFARQCLSVHSCPVLSLRLGSAPRGDRRGSGASRTPFALLAMVLLGTLPALAQNGVSDDRVSLPDGPGSVGGVGENVEINPDMGTSSFSVAIPVPAGASEATTPELALSYGSGQGLGAAGIGWDVSSPAISRMTSKGLPEYDVDDLFMADGSEL